MVKTINVNHSLRNVFPQLFIKMVDVQWMEIIVLSIPIIRAVHVNPIHLAKMVKIGIQTIFNVFVHRELDGMETNVWAAEEAKFGDWDRDASALMGLSLLAQNVR